MIELANIRPYVEKMAYIISIVLEMDVLICDASLRILGDFDHKGKVCTNVEILKESSVITKAMRKGEAVIYANSKIESEGCINCSQKDNCRTESIIAYPIKKGDKVIGGIGVYSQENKQKEKLTIHRPSLISFIESIAELILNKLEEEAESLELMASQKKMEEMIESINFALISIDESNKIIHCNKKFSQLISRVKLEKEKDFTKILEKISGKPLIDFVLTSRSFAEKSFLIKEGRKYSEYDVTISPVVIEDVYKGALIYLRESTELYAKANKLYNHVIATSFDDIIGESYDIQKVKEEAQAFAGSSSSVMIQGESGTGKEIFASAIHCASKYSKGPFITVNCAAIPDNLLESELFGHEEGAFTGSMKGGRVGKFELANNGTLFLDEIGELPIHLQPKLLRALQERKIQRIGSNRSIDINIRIITATNRKLEEMMATGQFREDLYYRLNVIPICIPALRYRKKDIGILVEYFLDMYTNMLEKEYISGFTKDAMEAMCNYDWPGNVRELQNAVEYAVNKCKAKEIQQGELPNKILKTATEEALYVPIPLKEMEEGAIKNALDYFGDTLEGKEKAAEHLGISRATLYRKIKEINKI